jgi:hypothetical protein
MLRDAVLAGQLAQLLNLAEMTSLKTQSCHANAPSPEVQHAHSGSRRDRESQEYAYSESGQAAACGATRPLGITLRADGVAELLDSSRFL